MKTFSRNLEISAGMLENFFIFPSHQMGQQEIQLPLFQDIWMYTEKGFRMGTKINSFWKIIGFFLGFPPYQNRIFTLLVYMIR